jgi:hypothetical protein
MTSTFILGLEIYRVLVIVFDYIYNTRECQWCHSCNACPILQVAAARGGYGGERYEKLEFQKKVEQKFKSLKDSAWQVLRLMS